MNDQTIKADAGKPRLTLVPRKMAYRIARVREYGLKRYPDGGVDNWKRVEIQRYREALLRHLYAYLDDPASRDQESGLLHLDHMLTNAAFIAELEEDIPEASLQIAESEPEESEPEEPKPILKKPRQRIDREAVKALRARGWSIKAIAEDPHVKCSEQTVRNILNDKEL